MNRQSTTNTFVAAILATLAIFVGSQSHAYPVQPKAATSNSAAIVINVKSEEKDRYQTVLNNALSELNTLGASNEFMAMLRDYFASIFLLVWEQPNNSNHHTDNTARSNSQGSLAVKGYSEKSDQAPKSSSLHTQRTTSPDVVVVGHTKATDTHPELVIDLSPDTANIVTVALNTANDEITLAGKEVTPKAEPIFEPVGAVEQNKAQSDTFKAVKQGFSNDAPVSKAPQTESAPTTNNYEKDSSQSAPEINNDVLTTVSTKHKADWDDELSKKTNTDFFTADKSTSFVQVSEPGVLILFCSALIGLVATRRKTI